MLNLRIGGIIVGAAFIISLVLGLAGGTAMPLLLVRPLIFAGLFFIIPGLIKMIVSRFLPELLEEEDTRKEERNQPGSRVNILEGDSAGTGAASRQAVFGALPDDSDEKLGDISELVSISRASQASNEMPQAGMDQNPQEDYTGEGDPVKFPESAPDGSPVKRARETGAADEDALPDLDSMAGAFLSPDKGEELDVPEYSVSASSPRPSFSSKNKAPAWSGDFNAKELASGLRTILSKEKEG